MSLAACRTTIHPALANSRDAGFLELPDFHSFDVGDAGMVELDGAVCLLSCKKHPFRRKLLREVRFSCDCIMRTQRFQHCVVNRKAVVEREGDSQSLRVCQHVALVVLIRLRALERSIHRQRSFLRAWEGASPRKRMLL